MSGPDFHRTGTGRRFFDQQLPDLVEKLDRIAMALERIEKRLDLVERADAKQPDEAKQ